MMIIVMIIVPLDINPRITIPYILQRKYITFSQICIKWKIMDNRMVLTLVLCYLYTQLTNMPIFNTIMNIISF